MTAEDREIARTAPAWWTGTDAQQTTAFLAGYDSLRTALAAERARADAAERDARRWRELLQETLARLDAATEGVQHGSQKA